MRALDDLCHYSTSIITLVIKSIIYTLFYFILSDIRIIIFSRNYFLAKELGNSGKESHKLADIDVIDEQDLREALANIEQKHEKEIDELIKSYKNSLCWIINRCGFGLEDFASTAKTEYSVVVLNSYL
ncbi:unnamed protein product [Coffea canephora]|uniref:Uncharacterized protein n=1 Tax=Coffea canephora TaxID=49390 RepID=A0A068UCT9_COFCA|nr:unnamed protein product [Coffea canephora]